MSEQPEIVSWQAFEKMPLQAAADMLRLLGEQLIVQLMAAEAKLAWPQKWAREVPDIWQSRRLWRTSRRAQWLKRAPLGATWAKRQERRFVRRVMQGKVSMDAYRKRFRRGLHQEMSSTTQFGLTPELWRLAGEAAWIGPDFQLPINRNLDRRLRSEILLEGGRPPQIFISPQALWALVALAAGQPLNRAARKSMALPLRRLREPLGELAAQQALRAEWAGFWDQWLLTRALPLVRKRFPSRDTPLLAALKKLPLREALGSKALPVPSLPPRFLPKRMWWYARYGVAATGARLASLGKQPKQLSGNMADPNWQQDLPVWAKQFDLIARNL